MYKNYFKTAFRFLVKNKTFSFINIAGLALGTLCCLYILLYVRQQYSYDKHHPGADHIYRVTSALQIPGDKHVNATVSPPTVAAMKNDFAEVDQFTRVVPPLGVSQHFIQYGEKTFSEKSVLFVDSTFFDVFAFHFNRGIGSKALIDPYTVVLTQALADKIFGTEDALGKKIVIEYSYGKDTYTVGGVVGESLGKSHIRANIFITMNGGGMGSFTRNSDSWAGNNFAYSYIKLKPATDVHLLESKLPAFLKKYGQEQMKALAMEKQLHLQQVSFIHTTSGFENELGKIVNPGFLKILILIAALIQIIACINFMNLSTARSSARAKEVGVRKVIGAGKFQLVRQFLTESVLLSFIGVLVAIPLLWILLPYLNQVTNAEISLSFISDYRLWLILAGLIVLTGIIAGSYPAFFLSAFQAIKVLKGNFTNQVSAAGIRRALVVFQFVLTVTLIFGILVIYYQLNFIKNKDLGYEKNQKLIFTFHTDETRKNSVAFAENLRRLADVKSVSRANNYLSQPILNDWTFYRSGESMATGQVTQFMVTDQYFTDANGIKMAAGRNFRLQDSGRVLINETMMKRMGLNTENAAGTNIFTKQINEEPRRFEIVGVMKDFNFNSLHEEIKPLLLMFNDKDSYLSNIIVNADPQNYKPFLGKLESMWKDYFPGVPFEYSFLDDEVQKLYETEITLSNIINAFTAIAIFISCLGLFGLVTFSAENRRKEIGIRKVLGASVSGITSLLARDFIKLVAVAILIAAPIAWWAMYEWLKGFAFKISISWWMLAIAGLFAIIIAIITVCFQAIKAAMANPVNSLRSE